MNLDKIFILTLVCLVTNIFSFDILDIIGAVIKHLPSPSSDPKLKPQTKCIEDVGCFSNRSPWYEPVERPYSAVPEDAKDIKFYFFTPKNANDSYSLENSNKSIESSPFNASLPTKILIHGFFGIDAAFQLELRQKDALLKIGDYNVIVVDWTKYSFSPYYQAVANTRSVAARTALLLKKIMKVRGVEAQSMHCIGFSLGAHTCGYIGKRIQNLGRISGMSPAGPYFGVDTSPEVHLIPSDAMFVDILNTAGGGLGNVQHLGHQNFYPNGGMRQPGCGKLPKGTSNLYVVKRIVENICAHYRALTLYTDTIETTNCTFKAVRCKTYDDFLDKKCSPEDSTEAVMGFHAMPMSGIGTNDSFFLRTAKSKPFCVPNSELPPPKSKRPSDKQRKHNVQLSILLRLIILGFDVI